MISEKIHEICLNMKKTFYKQEIYDILRWYEAQFILRRRFFYEAHQDIKYKKLKGVHEEGRLR